MMLSLAACAPVEPTPPVASPVCMVPVPFTPSFEPELQWEWTGGTVLPDFAHVLAAPVVVDVNDDSIPDVVFNAGRAEAVGTGEGPAVLRALRGDTGQELWAVTEPSLRTQAARSLAAGDLDGDGRVELCTFSEDTLGILCFRGNGSLLLRIQEPARKDNGGELSLADVDGDGHVELLDGHRVYADTGALKWSGAVPGTTAFGADLDLDGRQEVLNGPAVYRFDGSLLCATVGLEGARAAVGNFDADPEGEIVVAHGEQVSLFDTNCAHRWTVTVAGASLYAPNIADFDGDGLPEVGVGGAGAYAVLETDGTLKWRVALDSLGLVWSTTFDFEGDGKVEVVLNDEDALSIRDGATGALRFQSPLGASFRQKMPRVVDVDGDGSAEIVVASAIPPGRPTPSGIRVFRDRKEGWMGTRRIWNQPAYSVTHVEDDGRIPAHPTPPWLAPGLNTFHSNSQLPHLVPAPDLTVSVLGAACDGGTGALALTVRVDNVGDATVPPGLKVAVHASGALLGLATVSEGLDPRASKEVTLSLHGRPGGREEVSVGVDDDGTGLGRETECDEDNNRITATVELSCGLNVPPVALCRDVSVLADAACLGHASINAGSYDPDHGPGVLSLSESPPGPLGPGAHTVTLTASDGAASAQCVGTVTVVDATPPVLSCPSARVLECTDGGAVVTFSAEASDHCGPVSTLCVPPSGSILPLGTTRVSCTARDGSGNTTSCGFPVTVRDTQAPRPGAGKGLSLWPPNHKYVTVTLAQCAASAWDACTGELPLGSYGRITHVTSDEVEDEGGGGDTREDMIIDAGATSVRLRAERQGSSDGRVYTLHYIVTDASGNSTAARCRVDVAHDRSGAPAVDSGPRSCVGEGCPGG